MQNPRKKIRNIPIAVLTFLIVISFFVIVVFPSYNQYLTDNSMEQSISVVQFLRGGHSKHFDKNFHRILQKGFPDWEGRIEYEKKQRDLYNSAQNKLKIQKNFSQQRKKMRLLISRVQDFTSIIKK